MSHELQNDIARFAAEAVAQLTERAGGALDFSPASLHHVEEILGEASACRAELSDEIVSTLVERLGCYVLEVARREFGGEYFWHDTEQPVLVVGEPAFHVALTAWEKVRSRLNGDASDNLPFHYAGFAQRARSAEPGMRVLFV